MTKERSLHKEIVIAAPVAQVWKDWTTEEGLKSFFPPACRIDFRLGGAFEMLFMTDAPVGQQGSEGCTILAIEPEKMLSFTWNAPPHLPSVRKQFTTVVMRFESLGAKTRVSLSHYGWGESEEWTQAYHYFDAAWGRMLEEHAKKY